jgi:hypothetical protein
VAELADALDSKSTAMLGVRFAVAVSLPNGNKALSPLLWPTVPWIYTLAVSKPDNHRRDTHALRFTVLCEMFTMKSGNVIETHEHTGEFKDW